MSDRSATWIARIAFAAVAVLWLIAIVVEWLARELQTDQQLGGAAGFIVTVLSGLGLLMFPLAGLVIATRRRDHPIGWLLLAGGIGWGVLAGVTAYADYGVRLHPGSLPAADAAAALSQTAWAPPIGITVVFVPLLFPNGHLPSRRWRWIGYAAATAIAATIVLALLTPGLLDDTHYAPAENPFGIAGLGSVIDVLQFVIIVIPVCMVAAAASLVVRFRRSHEVERQQIKWLAAAVAIVAALFLSDLLISSVVVGSSPAEPGWLVVVDNVSVFALGLIPLAIMLSVLRYRLYEIDVIIRRTIIYACLVVALAVVYLGGIAVVGTLLRSFAGSSGTVAVTLSTLVVAAAFHPLRHGIQRVVDRRFYRAGYDAQEAVDEFNGRLREQIDLDTISDELRAVVTNTVHPAHASVWLRLDTTPTPPPTSGHPSRPARPPVPYGFAERRFIGGSGTARSRSSMSRTNKADPFDSSPKAK